MSLGSLTLRAPGTSMARERAESDIAIASPVSTQTKQFSELRRSIERLHREAGTKVIVVSSALPTNWKTEGFGGGKKETHLHFYGDLEFPNITDGDDAQAFITNLEIMAKD